MDGLETFQIIVSMEISSYAWKKYHRKQKVMCFWAQKLGKMCIVCTLCTAHVHCVHLLVVEIMSEVYFKYMKQYGS